MAAKKRTQPKSRKTSKSKVGNSLKAKSAKKKAPSRTKKPVSKAKKTSANKKVTSKKKTTKKKSGSSKRKVATRRSSAPKKTQKAVRAKAKVSKKSTQRSRRSTFTAALKQYETGLKLMQSEKFDKDKVAFGGLIKEFPNESELLDRTHVHIQACEHRIRKSRKPLRLQGASDYYEIGIAELNGKEIAQALEHLQHALKLSPKADYIHYALAAASALNGDREAALDFLGKAVDYRDENRFLAVNDDDFESLFQDSDFIHLTTPNAG